MKITIIKVLLVVGIVFFNFSGAFAQVEVSEIKAKAANFDGDMVTLGEAGWFLEEGEEPLYSPSPKKYFDAEGKIYRIKGRVPNLQNITPKDSTWAKETLVKVAYDGLITNFNKYSFVVDVLHGKQDTSLNDVCFAYERVPYILGDPLTWFTDYKKGTVEVFYKKEDFKEEKLPEFDEVVAQKAEELQALTESLYDSSGEVSEKVQGAVSAYVDTIGYFTPTFTDDNLNDYIREVSPWEFMANPPSAKEGDEQVLDRVIRWLTEYAEEEGGDELPKNISTLNYLLIEKKGELIEKIKRE